MKWYGPSHMSQLIKSTVPSYKKKINFKNRLLNLNFFSHVSLNKFNTSFALPTSWNFIFFKRTNSSSLLCCYLYTMSYFFYFSLDDHFSSVFYDKHSRVFRFQFKYYNNFYRIYWFFLREIFYSFTQLFFKKLKFKGKGYYIYKNWRNTISPQFGYSHRVRIYAFFISVKFLSKTSVLLFGINKQDLLIVAHRLRNKRPINIFTNRGVRFTRQIIYKKAGKISSYR